MKWKSRIEKWLKKFDSNGIHSGSLEVNEVKGPNRSEKICEELGAPVDSEIIGMLIERGLADEEMMEVIKATNLLDCQMMGDLSLEVEKMFAQKTLHRYGYHGLDHFYQVLDHYNEKSFSK